MKRFLVIAALAIVSLVAEFGGGEVVGRVAAQKQYLGIKGGWGEGDVRLYPHWTSPPVWGKWNGGIYWVYYGGGKENHYLYDHVAGGVSVELEFLQRGFQYASLTPGYSSERYMYGRHINSIMVPIMWQPHVFAFDERLRLYLNAGVTGSFNISSTEYFIDSETGKVETFDYEFQTVRDNRWGYGLVVGLGGGWAFDKIEVLAEGRYYFGYSDIVKRKTIYSGTQFLRSPLDNINFSIGVAYHWNHSGAWAKGPMQRDAARKARLDLEALENHQGETVFEIAE
ncbi:MAG: hypothetical protein E7134_00655 [Rikenellaceae bacterium]|nr:hypothetical protein [Rikenellaceae bacterium]